jgi:hypothetical protein
VPMSKRTTPLIIHAPLDHNVAGFKTTSIQGVLGAVLVVIITSLVFKKPLQFKCVVAAAVYGEISSLIFVCAFEIEASIFMSSIFIFWQPSVAFVMDKIFAKGAISNGQN